MLKRFEKNIRGRDFAVGDIHGCFSRLMDALDEVRFDFDRDRLFSVGDLVDRGHESHHVCDFIGKPWFHAVRGNHDDFAIRHAKIGELDFENYARNGGAWFMALPKDEQITIADALESLPHAMQVETDNGLVGIVHAECPFDNWSELVEALESNLTRTKSKAITDWLMWARERAESGYCGKINGLHALVVGHTPVREKATLGNVIYIDTMGWRKDGVFTILNLNQIGFL